MQVNRGPNLFTMTEDIGPTSMMKPARMLPTWTRKWGDADFADQDSHQWDFAFPSSLEVSLQWFHKDPKWVTNPIQHLLYNMNCQG